MNALLFSEQLDVFLSLIGDDLSHFIRVGADEYYIDSNNSIVLINDGYATNNRVVEVKTVVNDSFSNVKTFDNVELFFEPFNAGAISEAIFYTSKQESQRSISSDFDIREGTYKLSIPRNKLSRTYPDRMRDKYLISSYKINTAKLEDKFFSIPYIKTIFRYSFI